VFLGFIGICALYCLVVYCLALFKFSRKNTTGSYSKLQEQNRGELKFRSTSYLLAFFVTWIPVFVAQILQKTTHTASVPMFVFTAISSLLVPLTGFLDSIIYGWDKKLRDVIVRCFRGRGWRQRPKAGRLAVVGDHLQWIQDPYSINSTPGENKATIAGEERTETFNFSDSE